MIPVLQEVFLDKARGCAERHAAGLAIVTVGLRNVEAAVAALTDCLEPGIAIREEIYTGQLDGKEGLSVVATFSNILMLCADLIPKLDKSARDTHHKQIMQCTVSTFKRLGAISTKRRVEALMLPTDPAPFFGIM